MLCLDELILARDDGGIDHCQCSLPVAFADYCSLSTPWFPPLSLQISDVAFNDAAAVVIADALHLSYDEIFAQHGWFQHVTSEASWVGSSGFQQR